MTEEEIKLLKQKYLCDSNISTTDELIDESIATLESYFELMNIDDLHKNARLIVLPYLALIAVRRSKTMNWISVKDRLPNCNGCYLVFRPHYYDEDHGAVTLCYFDGTDTWHDDDRVNFERILSPTDITHWMPLPEPPEEEG